MHACGHSSIKFCGLVTLRLGVHFPPFKINLVFPIDAFLSIYAHIQVHLGIRENFHSIHPSGVHTHFFQKATCVLTGKFSKEKLAVISLESVLAFLFLLV